MAGRPKRKESTAHPGDIVKNARQQRRTPEEIEAANLVAEERKAKKLRAAQEKHEAGVQRAAAAEGRAREQDQHAQATAARPDLASAALKRSLRSETQAEEEQPLSPTHVESFAQPVPTDNSGMLIDEHREDVTGYSDADGDKDYEPGNGSGNSADGDGNGGGDIDVGSGEEGDEEDEEIEAQLAVLAKKLYAKKERAKKQQEKPKKGTLRAEIAGPWDEIPPSAATKRRHSGDVELSQAAKKPKAAVGGLKSNWQKEVGVPKLARRSTSSWSRSVPRASSTTSATSASSRHTSGVPSEEPGEFEHDEEPDSLSAARAAKAAVRGASTSQMGITLKKKTVTVDINGKTKQEPKQRFTNADLPFPPESFAADLKHFQKTVIPDVIDYAATHEDAFAVTSHPSWEPTVKDIYGRYFSAYACTDAVLYVAAAAVSNWRSDIGKRALKAVSDKLRNIKEFPTTQSRREWVRKQSDPDTMPFLYREPDTQSGSYRSELILKTFYGHIRIAIKTDKSYGHPTGAMSISAAALERALSLWKDGNLSIEGLPRKAKKKAQSFIASPWADRAMSYLPPIQTLTTQKWREIFGLSMQFKDSKEEDLFEPRSTDDDSSDVPYIDPRSRVVVSDDEPDDDDEEMIQ
ncbi:hypothetical protein C8R43DRAFT_1028169 [Mycena crocata]|nr:hypothetical protein C8R43DRAFT_1028169 [Mycena crocata]